MRDGFYQDPRTGPGHEYLEEIVLIEVFTPYAVDHGKICWWVARRSLEVSLWFDKQREHERARAFLEDFYRAVDGQGNPQSEGQAVEK